MMNLQSTLLAYSEWLDSEGLVIGDNGEDKRTHNELVDEFIEQWEGNDLTEPLIGGTRVEGATEIGAKE